MRAILALIGLAALVLVVLMSLGMVQLQQTEGMSLPTVKLEGGNAPAFKADVGSVDIGSSNQTVEVPTVSMTNKTISVPTIDIEKAEGQPK